MINKNSLLLFNACKEGNIGYITKYLDFDTVDILNKDNRTLLHIACLNNDNEMIDLILKFLPDVNIVDDHGFLPISYLIKNNNLEYIKIIIEDYNGVFNNQQLIDNLIICCIYDNDEIFKYLYEKINFNLNLLDKDNNSFLMVCAKYNSVKIFNFLMKNNIDINIVNNEGNNALAYSISSNSYSFFKELLEFSDINFSNNEGQTLLILSVIFQRYNMIHDLLSLGANIFKKDMNGNNCLHHAILKRDPKSIVKILSIDQSILNEQNFNEDTPLLLSLKERYDDISEMLLNYDCDLEITNNDNENAFTLTWKNGNIRLAKIILGKSNIIKKINDLSIHNIDKNINISIEENNLIQKNNNDLFVNESKNNIEQEIVSEDNIDELIEKSINDLSKSIDENINNIEIKANLESNNFCDISSISLEKDIEKSTIDDIDKINEIDENDFKLSLKRDAEEECEFLEEFKFKEIISDEIFINNIISNNSNQLGTNNKICDEKIEEEKISKIVNKELDSFSNIENNLEKTNFDNNQNELEKFRNTENTKQKNINDNKNENIQEDLNHLDREEWKVKESMNKNYNIKWLINKKEYKELENQEKDYTFMEGQIKISPIIYFAKIGKTKNIFEILKKDPTRIKDKSSNNKTALMFACQYNNINCAKLLMLVGADLNAIDDHGTTALMYAAFMGNEKIVRLLLENKADASIKDIEGMTALDIAVQSGNKEIVNLLNAYENQEIVSKTISINIDQIEYI